jgi:putative ABC transport system permease protein
MLNDLRFGARLLLKRPGVTLVAIITLALGIGANTAIFSVTNSLLLRPFDFHEVDRLVVVSATMPERGREYYSMTPANFVDLRRQQTVFAGMAAHRWVNSNLTGADEPERLSNVEVSADFFKLLGGEPALGRTFLSEDEQAGRSQVAVLGYSLWQRRFGSSTTIVGTTIQLDGKPYVVIGVMPKGFDFPKPVELWTPLALSDEEWNDRRSLTLQGIARLKEGVELELANTQVATIARRLAEQYPQTNTGVSAAVRLLRRTGSDYNDTFIGLLAAAGAFVLMIACVNIANMQLALATSRAREMAVRSALGAGRVALFRQLLSESVLLGLLGGFGALLVAFWLIDYVRASIPLETVQHISGWERIGIDAEVLSFNLAVSFASAIIFGLIPALQASRPNPNESLKEGGRSSGASVGRQRMRSALIVAEVALAFVLLVSAGLMVKGFARLAQNQKKGFDPQNVLTLRTTLSTTQYPQDHQVAAFYRDAQERLHAVPGIKSVTVASFLPGTSWWDATEFQIEGQPAQPPGQSQVVTCQKVSAAYFQTVRIPIVKGRAFSVGRDPSAPREAVISQAMEKRYFANEPIGKQVRPDSDDSSASPWYTIVGVAGDVSRFVFDREVQPMLYLPSEQVVDRGAYFLLRTSGDPMAAVPAVRAQINSLDDTLPVYEIKSHEQAITDVLAGIRLATEMMAMFGLLALVLAAVGVYGVIAYSVTQRTHEIGVRTALGAQPRDVLGLVIGQALKLAAVGLAIGLPVALGLGRVMAGALFGMVALDAMTFAGFTLLLATVALLAGYVPARRAMTVDPMVALRYE